MKVKRGRFVYTILFAGCIVFCACKPGFVVQPDLNNKIYQVTDVTGVHNYCYFKISNISKYSCQVTFDKPLQNLTLVSALPATLAPDQTIEAKFEITNSFNTSACGAPCTVEEINLKANWIQYDPSYYYVSKATVEWTKPVIEENCLVMGGNVGDANNSYEGVLCTINKPNQTSGTKYQFGQIDEIHNPNDFDIEILVNNKPDALGHKPICLTSVTYGDVTGEWAPLKAHSSLKFGDMIKTNFGPVGTPTNIACLTVNDAFAYVWSQNHTLDAGGRKWITLRVTVK